MKNQTHALPKRRWRDALLLNEDLNFLLTNRIPRRWATQAMGWWSGIRSPWLTRASIALWRLFTDLDLSEAKHSKFHSLRECFIRELKPGARPIADGPEWLTSPCDALVGACGPIAQGLVLQAKGMPYTLSELLGSAADAVEFEGGQFVTLRLTSAMYHRLHAPDAGRIEQVRYISGDTWNVNPIALARIERLFCRNERAVMRLRLHDGPQLLMVPVAAILVASLRLHCLGDEPYPRRRGACETPCAAQVQRGEELGWFEHGSTVVMLLPPGFELLSGEGQTLRMGQALVRRLPVIRAS
ncbi:phosphatidylserine decarboxylase [Inhella inkyongensis]|uniref:phosphatidylserine decarboxylase n=1 Tax=Inhella inkyongensis TaxID=392593 RepID=A0A840S2A4_9BURK|nr:archaetidylserine decarboxylase [Inhella inkyongensis]MBB5203873.1 phosphatidylserine decarboxylase [Inhella inkyongensis]